MNLFKLRLMLFAIFMAFGGYAIAQCTTPVITSIGNSGPACPGGNVTLTADGTVNGISSSFIRVAGIGANQGNREMDAIFVHGDRPGSIARITNVQFNAIFSAQPTNAAKAAAIKAQYDVLLFTWASPQNTALNWGLIDAYLAIGGSIFWEDDQNIHRLNDGTSNSVQGYATGGALGCGYTIVSPAPFPALVANGINGCFANHHLGVNSWPSWMKAYIKGGTQTLAIAGVHPTGGGRLIVQGPDQDFHAVHGAPPGTVGANQYQILLNQIDFLAAEQTGISWTGPNGFTSNEKSPILTNITAADAGVYTAKLTNVSGGGCFTTATTTVTVNSATVPTITASGKTDLCPGSTVTLTASAGSAYLWSNGSTAPSITVGSQGNYTVKVTGANGCAATSTLLTVNVDNIYCNQPPVAVCKNITVSAGNGCTGTANPSDFDGGSADADGDAMTYSVFPAGPYAIGTTNVTLTVTDSKGASSSCSTTITVVDDTAPAVSCPSSVSVSNDPGQCGAFVTVPAPAISDNCNVVCNTDGLDEYPAGNVTGQSPQWTVWPGGQSAEVTTERYLSAPNSLKVTGHPLGGPVDQVFKLGNQTYGNWTLSFSIYIPSGNTGYYNLQHTESLNSWAHQVKFNSDGVGVLNSTGPNTIFSYPQDQWFEVKQLIDQGTDQTSLYINGVHVKTWQFSTHANHPAINNQLGAVNFFPVSNSNFMGAPEPNPTATPLFFVDDITLCGDATQIGAYVSRRYSKQYPVGTTPVAITISDMAGNKTTCNSFAVTVSDDEDPTNSGLSPVSVNADNGSCTATGVQLGSPVTGDNCGVASVTNDAPSHYPVGATDVTWTVTDIHGNSTSLVQKVIVTDNQAPVITCTTDKFFCYAGSQYNVGMLSVSDNCGIGSLSFDITGATVRSGNGASASGLFNVGTSTIVWTVTDIHGNVSTCSSTVTVNPPVSVGVPDAMAYTAGVQANTVYIGYAPAQSVTLSAQPAGGTAPYSYSWSNGATTSSITVSPASAGSHNYTVTITDAKGCTASFTKTITAVDVRCGNKNDKVLVCQKTNSNSNPYVQICISANAVASHLAKGSYLGACTNNAVTRTSRPSVQEASAKAVMAYPNPSRGIVNLQLKNFTAGKVNVQVMNALGKLVISKDVNVSYLLQDETLDLQGMPAGMYQVRIVGNDGVVTTGIVIGR